MEHYVYIAEYDGVVVYIGKGSGSRFRHLNSGTSNCYQANRVHFEGGSVSVNIIANFTTSEDALSFERDLIIELKPTWNIITFTPGEYRVNFPNRRAPDLTLAGSRSSKVVPKGRSKFLGVSYKKKAIGGKNAGTVAKQWTAKVRHDGKYKHIGNYVREVDAAIARDLYIINNKLQGFVLNFPDKNYSEILDEYVEWD